MAAGVAVDIAAPGQPEAAATCGAEGTMSDMSGPAADGGNAAANSKPPKTFCVNGNAYTRLRLLGRGGSSKVYEVRAPCGSLRALKRVTTGGAHLEALANEVTLLRQLADCPHVIQVFDAEISAERGVLNIVMERGEMDLARFLQTHVDITIGDIQKLWRQMLEAVQVIHGERIVHSDLKPSNFLLVDGRLKIIDFGIARRIAAETTNISREQSVGTISYMAPEAIANGRVKLARSSDIWSLGIILYQIVYLRSPFAHLEPMQRYFAISDPAVPVQYPAEHRLVGHSDATKALVIDTLQRCLQRDPLLRASIPELLEHDFLADTQRITRRQFDRAIEALVAGFYAASDAVLSAALSEVDDVDVSAAEDPDPDASSAHDEAWQLIADDVWERLAQESNGENAENILPFQPLVGTGCGVPQSLAHFRSWFSRSAKRRRITAYRDANSNALREEGTVPPSGNVLASGVCGVETAPPSREQIPAPPPPPASSIARRTPLAPVFGAVAVNGATAIDAALLQQKKSGLKTKPERRPSPIMKENILPSKGDNPVLKRLRQHALAGVEEETQEMSQVTRWAVSSGA
jgi:serine/threonine-protein kinase TTK/MPS1